MIGLDLHHILHFGLVVIKGTHHRSVEKLSDALDLGVGRRGVHAVC